MRDNRKKKYQEPVTMSLKLTSMIDVIFLLLIYFVVTASFSFGEGVLTAKLPAIGGVKIQPEMPERPLLVHVRGTGMSSLSGEVEMNGKVLSFRELKQELISGKAIGLYSSTTKVQIKSTPDVRWQYVVEAFNTFVGAGMRKINMQGV